MSNKEKSSELILIPQYLSETLNNTSYSLTRVKVCNEGCQTECETAFEVCGVGCEVSSQSCGSCETWCQSACQRHCQGCESDLDDCVTCERCMGDACQYACEAACEIEFEIVPVPLIEPWSWEESNGSASDEQTMLAYEAITSKGECADFSYLVWNDLIEKVAEVRKTGDEEPSWNSSYLSKDDTKMSLEDKTLTAERFNSLWINIDTLKSTDISAQKSGNIVMGNYFITLTSKLNSYIDDLNDQAMEI